MEKVKYGKKYETVEEDDFRMHIYLQNKLKIEKHNLAYEKGIYTFKLGMNQFGDLLQFLSFNECLFQLPHEAHKITHGLKNVTEGATKANRATFISPANVKVPAEIDWRKKGAVTGVKDQGQCGSGWAFSADLTSRWHQYVTSHLEFESHIAECMQWLEDIKNKLAYCSDLSASSQKDLEGKLETIQDLLLYKEEGFSKVQGTVELAQTVLANTAPSGHDAINQILAKLQEEWNWFSGGSALQEDRSPYIFE
ncbi:hypothetical protein C0J52_04485 [Blattella germanica]|nr:hypothetical protein C0J52_04485 [Blattella germanica]